ncbi:MAG: MBL fold metallo-hydrolase [Clostridia bacterium]|nr:MBL fold metallo-hydrolase [Clostridia bacterium]
MSRLKVCTLVSGSSANCTYVEVDGCGLLIDAGAGIRRTEALLNSVDSSLSKVKGIFITHEHSDHISGLKTITKKYRIPILANRSTLDEISFLLPEVDSDLFCVLPTGGNAKSGAFSVTSFPCMHDSVECAGYVIDTGLCKVGISTDLGQITDDVTNALNGCKVLVFEANHDIDMLRNGPYPYSLKQRISGPNGHLSNQQAGEALTEFVQKGTEQVFLAHLSKDNNTESLCRCTVENALRRSGIEAEKDVRVRVAPRSDRSEVFCL